MTTRDFEQTLVLIKPDALRNSLTGYILSQLSEVHCGLRFAATKVIHVSRMLAEQHYAEHAGKPFFPAIISYIMGIEHYPDEAWKRRVIAIVLQGADAVQKIRAVVGPTNPHQAREVKSGCIRSLGTVVPIKDKSGKVIGQRMDNLIHASATDKEAEREIKLWFRPTDFPPLMQAYPVEESFEHYYIKGKRLFTTYSPGSICVLAPGDIVWKSDIRVLQQVQHGEPTDCPLEAVIAKYLINDRRDMPPSETGPEKPFLWKVLGFIGTKLKKALMGN